MIGQSLGPLSVAIGFIPSACTRFLESIFLEGSAAGPRYSGEGLVPASK